jgi:hypothetical protein
MPSEFPDLLFCDFDGVLHSADLSHYRASPGSRIKLADDSLFENCGILESLLDPYPSVRIVLSTSWVQVHGIHVTKGFLPPNLRSRVIGATWDSRHLAPADFNALSRHEQIKLDVHRREPHRWLAVDDDAKGWDPADADHLALMPADFGLSDALAQAHLKDRLRFQFGTSEI